MSDPFLGEIRVVGFTFAPYGWAMCDGSLLAINQNTALFSLLGVTYGGNGTTNFNLPDLRGRSPVGTGTGTGLTPITPGQTGGAENATLTINQMPSHTHTAQSGGSVAVSGSVAIPACSSPASSSGTPGTTTVLGQVTAEGRPGALYTTTTPNTTLAPFTVQSSGTAPGVTIGSTGGSLPVPVRSPYLGLTCVIALQGVFPTRG